MPTGERKKIRHNNNNNNRKKIFSKPRNTSNGHIKTRKCSTILGMAWSWTIKLFGKRKMCTHTQTQWHAQRERTAESDVRITCGCSRTRTFTHTATNSTKLKKAPIFYFGRARARAMWVSQPYIGGFTLDCRFMRHATLRVFDDSSVSIFFLFFHGEHNAIAYRLTRVPNVQVLVSEAHRFRTTRENEIGKEEKINIEHIARTHRKKGTREKTKTHT